VDEFGPTRVATYRSDDGSSANQRMSGWKEHDGWVSKFALHRVAAPLERIILGTVVVREGTLDPVALSRVVADHPVKSNQAIDFALLFAVALPAVIRH
jgi:hypothetical protein